jgi:ZIP family zinc transporter
MFDAADRYALLLSLLAGLATSVGGLIAVWRKPDQKLLAFLLGTAVGVMATLSVVELYVKNVLENGFVGITLATACGAMVYVVVEPLLPKTEVLEARVAADAAEAGKGGVDENQITGKMSKARLMRLGLLMAITMTLHNLPEGFAVAFSSYTSVGPVMAAAIGVHNVPEGIIVAAPVFAATGSRRRALLMATVSGLSEPAGALLALCFVKPYLTPTLLQYLLAATGGMMSAVCAIELLPEGRKCRNDAALARGVLVGTAVMLGTLYAGV